MDMNILFLLVNTFYARRSRSTRYHKFSILPGDAVCTLEEVFEVFDDISDGLTLDKETCWSLQCVLEHCKLDEPCSAIFFFNFVHIYSCNLKKKKHLK